MKFDIISDQYSSATSSTKVTDQLIKLSLNKLDPNKCKNCNKPKYKNQGDLTDIELQVIAQGVCSKKCLN